MDRVLIYPGQIPLETDLLGTNRNVVVALSKLAAAMFGTNTIVNGLSVGPSSPAALTVDVQPGEIYSPQNLDGSAYSSLPADTAHQIVKQGIILDKVTLSCPAPATTGFSINYLIQATLSEVDAIPVVLPFYNASNPSLAYSGPNNTGASSNTLRDCNVALVAKAGTAATTGTQTTPAPDSGYVGIAVVTVAHLQSTITSGNISVYSAAPVVGAPLNTGRLINIQTFTTSGTYTPTPGTNSIIVEAVGGGGSGGAAPATGASTCSAAAGGGAGAYAKSRYTNGFSGGIAVTIGAAGVGPAAGLNSGNTGGTTTFGALISCPGGTGGLAIAAFTPPAGGGSNGNNTAAPTGGNILALAGMAGANGQAFAAGNPQAGAGGSNPLGTGGWAPTGNGARAPAGYGAGSSGANAQNSSAAQAGLDGTRGVVIVYEYA